MEEMVKLGEAANLVSVDSFGAQTAENTTPLHIWGKYKRSLIVWRRREVHHGDITLDGAAQCTVEQ
jgi:hypothetical protein